MHERDSFGARYRRPSVSHFTGINDAEITVTFEPSVDERRVVEVVRAFLAVSPEEARRLAKDSIAIVAALRSTGNFEISSEPEPWQHCRSAFTIRHTASVGAFANIANDFKHIDNNGFDDDDDAELRRDRECTNRTTAKEKKACFRRCMHNFFVRKSSNIQTKRSVHFVLRKGKTFRNETGNCKHNKRVLRRGGCGGVGWLRRRQNSHAADKHDGRNVPFRRVRAANLLQIAVLKTLPRRLQNETEK